MPTFSERGVQVKVTKHVEKRAADAKYAATAAGMEYAKECVTSVSHPVEAPAFAPRCFPGRVALLLLAALLALATLVTLGACGKSDSEVIREGLTNDLGALKDATSKEFVALSSETQDMLSSQGVEIDDFTGIWLEGYDFTIGDIQINGSEAVARVDITVKQLGPVLDAVVAEIQSSDQAYDTLEAATAAIGQLLAERLAEAAPTTTTIEIPCTKTDNEWRVSDRMQDELLQQALLGESEFL
jgi:hypothetical protein